MVAVNEGNVAAVSAFLQLGANIATVPDHLQIPRMTNRFDTLDDIQEYVVHKHRRILISHVLVNAAGGLDQSEAERLVDNTLPTSEYDGFRSDAWNEQYTYEICIVSTLSRHDSYILTLSFKQFLDKWYEHLAETNLKACDTWHVFCGSLDTPSDGYLVYHPAEDFYSKWVPLPELHGEPGNVKTDVSQRLTNRAR